MDKPLVSICVPTYHAKGEQERILKRLIKSVREQDYPNIELVISDQDVVEDNGQKMLDFMDGNVRVKYIAYDGPKSPAMNTNNAILNASGDLIHILNHDDFYYHSTALSDMVRLLEDRKAGWVVCQCLHTNANETVLERLHTPRWPGEKDMVEGVNVIGCPSVALFRKSLGVSCNPDYELCLDCALWIDLFRKSGPPAVMGSVGVVIRMWPNQLSQNMDYVRSLENDKVKLRKAYGYT